jgi:PhoH-like ATPase
MELLLDPDVKLVSLIGKAGTGKTLMALAAGLQMVIDEQRYNRLIVARPIHPLGRDLGYLPGDVDDKIRPWMQPIFDNLEYILHCNSEELSKSQITHQYFLDKGWLVVEPLTYIRGRSIPNQYLLIDEAQNLTPHETKSIITRAGHGTKIVLTGDPYQIDHPFLDTTSNGISYLVQRFQNQHLYGHVTLTKGERSELAEAASNLL